jgi:hypothetical protein
MNTPTFEQSARDLARRIDQSRLDHARRVAAILTREKRMAGLLSSGCTLAEARAIVSASPICEHGLYRDLCPECSPLR